ncbi:helix-turn-helix transcriptional regulator [Variovorax sp. YR752]|uniref:helix-turn-helix transcriptional regulator n=1 Tax=Variovorax sp. YR752 TaxID=1884383 RepID=UPI003137CD23
MNGKQTHAITTIRQACFAGLGGRTLMPIVAAQLRALVPAACCQFTWSSETGRITNFWCDTFMPRRTAWIILNHRRYEADAGVSFRELAMFGAPTGNLRAWWERGFERSATYAAVFEPYGFKWFLDGVVRDAQRPYGVLAMIRRRDQPDFSPDEEALVGRVLPYLAHALQVQAMRPSRFVSAGRSALVVCSEEGEVLEWSEAAHRLAVFALLERIDLDARVGSGDFDDARAALRCVARELSQRLQDGDEAGGLPTIVRHNGWGEFVLRGYRLRGGAGATTRLGILIEQLVPFESHLLERINATTLTARQKEIALLSAKGLANAQIASQLNISPHTLKEYFKDIYSRLEINSQRQLVERLSA